MDEVEKTIQKIGNNYGWYNLLKVMQVCNGLPKITFSIGRRRTGKTVYYTRLFTELWKDHHKQFFWLRNRNVELNDRFCEHFLDDGKSKGYVPQDWISCKDGIFDENGEQCGYFQAISTFSNLRGSSYGGNVKLIIFDELVPELADQTKGSGGYPIGCAKGLLSISKTILSGADDGHILIGSNFISLSNPYFVNYRIYPGKQDVTYYPEKYMAIEVLNKKYRCAIADDSEWGRLYASVGDTDYADAREECNLMDYIAQVPKGAKMDMYQFEDDSKNGYRIWALGDMYYFTNAKLDEKYPVFTKDRTSMGNGRYPIQTSTRKVLGQIIDQGRARFNNANTMFAMMNIIFGDR